MAQHHRRCRAGHCVAWCALAEEERNGAREQAIRADERARVVAFIRARGRKLGGPAIVSEDIADAIARGDHEKEKTDG